LKRLKGIKSVSIHFFKGIKSTKKGRNYLKENFCNKSEADLARYFGLSETSVRKTHKKLGLKSIKAEITALQFSADNNKAQKKNIDKKKIMFFSRPFLFMVIEVIAVILLVFFIFLGSFSMKRDDSSTELKEIIKPLHISDLNILFITLDTTRADHLGCYGYDRAQTPNIDNLAERGVLFKTAVCQSPLTLPSHASIFTGTYPFYHGVRDNGFRLEPDKTTLAEVLKNNGMITSAFIGAFVLDSKWGLDQGIDYYYDNFDFTQYKRISLDSVQRRGEYVIKAFFEWFEKNYQKRFFSWIHLYDPHTPYEPPDEYKTRFSKWKSGLYDGEIAYVDDLIGKLLNRLNVKNVLQKTLIVIVGDHGESLGQHKELTHGFFVYEATTSVPLIIHFPDSKLGGRKIDECVETIDIMPTLLEILGFKIPPGVQGKSLLPLIMKKNLIHERLAYSETYFPRYHFGWSELISLRNSRYKYIQAPAPELYDIVDDPQELSNIYKQNIRQAKYFEQKLKVLHQEWSAQGIETKEPPKLDDKTAEKLKTLGYLGTFTSQAKMKKTGPLADPKDKIHIFNLMERAEGNFAEDRLEEALKIVTEVTEKDPMIKEARQLRAQILLMLNKIEETIKECKEALKIDPEYKDVMFNLALAYKNQKKYEEAIAEYEKIMSLDPKDYKPFYSLGEIYMRMNNVDKAIFYLQQAVKLEPEHSSMAHHLLGTAYLEKKMFEQAEIEFKKALETYLHIPNGHFELALVYEEKNEPEKAIKEYKKEIELHPADYRAHFNLAKLYVRLGYMREGIQHFQEAINHKKDFANGYLFLAKAYLDLGEKFEEAILLAKKGLILAPQSEYAPLAHFILADIYNRLGQFSKSREEFRKGKELQQELENKKKNNLQL